MLKIAITIIFTILITEFFVFLKMQKPVADLKNKAITSVSSLAESSPLIIRGSIPYWDQNNAFESFKKNVEAFDYVNLFWYYITTNGEIQKYNYTNEDKSIIDFAHANNVKVLAVITNLPEEEGTTWDSKRVENVLRNSSARKKHISDIANKLESLNFDGVNIDYESVEASQKNNFTFFIKELTGILHEKNKIVSVSLHPKTGNEKENENIGAFQDWSNLADVVDQLSIMAYEEHWDESSAGPIASINWVQNIIAYTQKLKLPEEKLFLGIPLYGYDWNKDNDSKAHGLTFNDVENLLKTFNAEEKWDSYSRSPYFYYTAKGDMHEVWFENSESIAAKINLARENNLSGVTFWRLGEEDPRIWQNIINNN